MTWRLSTGLVLSTPVLLAGLVAGPTQVLAQSHGTVELGEQGEPATTRQEILLRKREEKRDELAPHVVSGAESRVLAFERGNFPANVFERGWRQIRPVIGGMPSGSGFVGGVGFLNGLDREAFEFEATARLSTRLFTSFDAEVQFPTARSDLPVRAHLGVRTSDFRGLRFFGLGADTRSADRVTYQLQERGVDAGLTAEAGRFLTVDVHGG